MIARKTGKCEHGRHSMFVTCDRPLLGLFGHRRYEIHCTGGCGTEIREPRFPRWMHHAWKRIDELTRKTPRRSVE